MTEEARFLKKKKKKNWRLEFGLNESKLRSETRFFAIYSSLFISFSHMVFLKIACNDSEPQFLTSSRGKIHKKNFGGPNFCQRDQNRA